MSAEGSHPAVSEDCIDTKPKTEKKGNAYCWGKTGRIITEKHYLAASQNTEGSFFYFEICSSYPIGAQIYRERHQEECYRRAKDLAGQCMSDIQAKRNAIPTYDRLQNLQQKLIRDTIVSRKSKDYSVAPRRLIEAVIQDVLYNPPEIFGKNDTLMERQLKLGRWIYERLKASTIVYKKLYEREELVKRGRWEILLPIDTGTTIRKVFAALIGERQAYLLLADIAKHLGIKCLPELQAWHITGVDREEPEKIAEEERTVSLTILSILISSPEPESLAANKYRLIFYICHLPQILSLFTAVLKVIHFTLKVWITQLT